MKIAIMQPYIFPYIGYFQLLNVVDKFIVYDDVSFIKQGWINRNYILANNKPLLFTIPIANISSFKKINETTINQAVYQQWQDKFLKTVQLNYQKAPFFNPVFEGIKKVFDSNADSLTTILLKSLQFVIDYLNLQTQVESTSSVYCNCDLSGQERILDICKKEKASSYYNLIGGKSLYNKSDFERESIALYFIRPSININTTGQNGEEMHSHLSMIHVLMHNSPETVRQLLKQYEIS
ncbi:MAG: hypothetical protein EOO10_11695 [Chitinophagaceae bacterium]|nr:MAG: hypothetical protein EOO10_11695 [Chitinophagaceae bacterium]